MIVFAILNHFPVFCETESACQFLLGSKSVGISEGARCGWLAFVAMAALGMSCHPSTKQMLLSGANHDKDGHDLTRTEPLRLQRCPGEGDLGSSPQSKEKVAKDWAGQNFVIIFIHPEGFLIFLPLSSLNRSLFRNVPFNFHITCECLNKSSCYRFQSHCFAVGNAFCILLSFTRTEICFMN